MKEITSYANEYLIKEIKNLKIEIEKLKKIRVVTTYQDLVDFWDNKYDEQWNTI